MPTAPLYLSVLRLSSIALLACLSLLPPTAAAATGGDIAVVVRPDTPADNLSFNDIRKLLLGERQFWNSSLRVTLLIRAPAAREREVVLKTIYRMSETQFRQFWISKVFRAEATSGPKIVYSNEMAAELVAAIPGSVAFVDAAQVPKGLKVLKIDGKLPGDKDYPLK
jgi:ABC-type phosphate transport system substrate-binding protein